MFSPLAPVPNTMLQLPPLGVFRDWTCGAPCLAGIAVSNRPFVFFLAIAQRIEAIFIVDLGRSGGILSSLPNSSVVCRFLGLSKSFLQVKQLQKLLVNLD